MELNNKLYTLSTVSRSFDKYHVDNNKIHLVSSIFYANSFEVNSNTNFNSVHYIIRILPVDLDIFEVITHNSTCIEFRVSIVYFLNSLLNSSVEGFIEVLIGNRFETEKENHSLLNNVLFVYEDLSWPTIQTVFKQININISGGSISKRQILSTAEYNLSSMLFSLGYNLVDIYNSSIILSKLLQRYKDIGNSKISFDLEINLGLKLNKLQIYLKLNIENINKEIIDLELDFKSSSGTLLKFEKDLLQTGDHNKDSKNLTTTRSLKLDKNIFNTKGKIEKLSKQISALKSKLTELNKEVSKLDNLSPSEIRDKYLKLVVNTNRRSDVYNFKKYFNKRKLRGVID